MTLSGHPYTHKTEFNPTTWQTELRLSPIRLQAATIRLSRIDTIENTRGRREASISTRLRRLMEGNGYDQGDDPSRGDIKCAGKLWRHEFDARLGVGNLASLILN